MTQTMNKNTRHPKNKRRISPSELSSNWKGEKIYKPGDRITFNAPVPWSKGEYKIITDTVQRVYPHFIFTRKKYCVKRIDIKGFK